MLLHDCCLCDFSRTFRRTVTWWSHSSVRRRRQIGDVSLLISVDSVHWCSQPVPKAVRHGGYCYKHNWSQPLTPQSIIPSLNHRDLQRHVGVNNLPKVDTRLVCCIQHVRSLVTRKQVCNKWKSLLRESVLTVLSHTETNRDSARTRKKYVLTKYPL